MDRHSNYTCTFLSINYARIDHPDEGVEEDFARCAK